MTVLTLSTRSATAKLSLTRLGGRISSGACAPKPATEPRSLIFEAFWGSFWLHFGTPRASKNKVFVWRVLHFSKNRGVRKKTPKMETWLSREREAREKREPQASQATEKTRRRAQATARRSKAKHHEAQP